MVPSEDPDLKKILYSCGCVDVENSRGERKSLFVDPQAIFTRGAQEEQGSVFYEQAHTSQNKGEPMPRGGISGEVW